MPKIHFEKKVKAERKKVFNITTNYEEYQKTLPEFFPSVRVRSSRDNVAVVEEHVRIADKELVMMTKHIKSYPETHEVFVIGGDGKGSHIIEKYENIEGGTKIIVDADIKLKGTLKILGFFGKRKFTKGLTNIMDGFAKIAEN